MTVRYFCPIEACGWFHDEADLEPPTLVPWQRVPDTALAQLTDRVMTAEKVIAAHLECHPRLDFVKEINQQRTNAEMWQISADRQRRRANAAEAKYASLEGALKAAADFTTAMDALTTMRMPSRAEWETAKAGLLALAGPDGGVIDAEA